MTNRGKGLLIAGGGGILVWVFIIFVFTMLTGCQTKETAARFSQAQSDIQACYATVAQAQAAQQLPRFKDDRDLLVYLVVQKMTANNPYNHCDDAYIAMINSDRSKMDGILRTTSTLGGIGLGIVGVKVLADGFNSGGTETTNNTNYTNSRVVSNSPASGGSTISASGTGLGIGNSFNDGNGQQVSGNMPRTSPINHSDNVDNRPESNSGENSDFDPGVGEDIVDSEFPEGTPEILPE